METTPRPVIDLVVRSVCGSEVERLVRLTGGGLNETYRVEVPNDMPVVVRIARQPVAWFTDEVHVMAQARGVGVPTPEVLGVEQVDHGGELLSFSILRLVPGRSLDELAGELSASDLERLVMDSGESLGTGAQRRPRPGHSARARAARRALRRPRAACRRPGAWSGGGRGRRARC
jgi:aminoglycoside phosphotransferase (APT) family kinase protein